MDCVTLPQGLRSSLNGDLLANAVFRQCHMAPEPTVCKTGGFVESLVSQRVEMKTSRTP